MTLIPYMCTEINVVNNIYGDKISGLCPIAGIIILLINKYFWMAD